MFFPVLILRIYLSFRRRRILGAWLALEINMVRVLPLLRVDSTGFSGEVRIKYFLVQALGSSVFLIAYFWSQIWATATGLVVLSLGLKAGAAPLHLWFIRVVRVRGWEVVFLLSTVQKLIPLLLLQWEGSNVLLLLLVGVSALVPGWAAFKHTGLRSIIGYSSVFTLSWLLVRLPYARWWLVYLLFYRITLAALLRSISLKAGYSISCFQLGGGSLMESLTLLIVFCSIGGVPPLLGFWIKLCVLNLIATSGLFILIGLILLGSIWIAYAYLRVRYLGARREGSQSVWGDKANSSSLAAAWLVLLLFPAVGLIWILSRSVITWNFDFQNPRHSGLGT